MVDEQNMKTGLWWKDTDREKPRNSEKDISLCLLVFFCAKFAEIQQNFR